MFARRMRHISREKNKPHPFHVKSTWGPPIQQSVALESYLKRIKSQLAEIELAKPKNNLPLAEREALNALKRDTTTKADKGTTTVFMNTQDKMKEGQIQLDKEEHYKNLASPIVVDTHGKVEQLINDHYYGNHTDETIKKWLCQTPSPPHISEFYTLTKIHKPTRVGRPIIPGCDGPTEKLSTFVDKLLQPIAQKQKSYLKD